MATNPENNQSPGGEATGAAHRILSTARPRAPAGKGRLTRALTPRVRLYACIAAANHGTSIARIMGEGRCRPEVLARREIWRRLHDDGFSLAAIGRFTNRDHSTVIHGLRKA
jgi:hypothetical protein